MADDKRTTTPVPTATPTSSVETEFSSFENLTRKLLKVTKPELDRELKASRSGDNEEIADA